MKVLSLLQPWAYLLMMNIKRVETRSWPTTHRGLLNIHASKGYSKEGEALWNQLSSEGIVNWNIAEYYEATPQTFESLTRGAIIGAVYLSDCRLMTEKLIEAQTTLERRLGDWKPGRFAFVTNSPQLIRPIPYRGQLGMWEWDGQEAPPSKRPRSEQQQFAIAQAVMARKRKKRVARVETTEQLPFQRIPRKFDFSV
jgi:hypothetical protein